MLLFRSVFAMQFAATQEANMNTTILVSEKCAFEGTTRFEDGLRLPLGISVNFPSFAAGILTEVRHYNPVHVKIIPT